VSAAVLRAVYRRWVCGRSARPNFCYHRSCRESGKRLQVGKKRDTRRRNESTHDEMYVEFSFERETCSPCFFLLRMTRSCVHVTLFDDFLICHRSYVSRSVNRIEENFERVTAASLFPVYRFDSPYVSNASLPPHSMMNRQRVDRDLAVGR